MDKPVEPFVSIIICFLNEERFLEEAIRSVINQNYNNWELILIDDGSADQSTTIALNFEKEYAGKIYYYDHDNHINKGLSASRNHGISKSKGELIAFLDADDVWRPVKLSQQVGVFNENPSIGMLIESSLYWWDWNDSKMDNILIPVGVEGNKIYKAPYLTLNLYPLGEGAAPCPSSIMVKREALERSGYFEASFTKEYALYEDQAFLCKMYLKEEVFVSSECNNLYRQHPNSIVQTVKTAGHYNKVRKHYFNWFKSYLIKNNIHNPQIDFVLRDNLFQLNYPSLYKLKKKISNKFRKIIKSPK